MMAPARSAGDAAEAATSASMETTRSSGSSSNMSPTAPLPTRPLTADGDPSSVAAVLRLLGRCISGPSANSSWQE
jgi:hypothetical protein